jgi:glycosyltransferase involved in cell wall biosynthesis
LAREVIREVAADGVALLWIYNGYAFESRFALEVMGKTGCPLVIELEDMPFARKRPANLKPMLDNYYLQRALPEASLVTCVNERISQALGVKPKKTLLLPGLVDNALLDPVTAKAPFSGTVHTAGYFGNLSVEKGAHLILQLVQNPPIGWRFVVTGSGPLLGDFSAAAQQHPEVLHFVSNASDQTVVAGMLECDAILNPHQSIAAMGNGIFPFKVLEALASGRLVISTALPVCGLPLEAAVLYFDHDVASLYAALEASSKFYAAHVSAIASLASDVRVRFSELALTNEIRRQFFPVGVSG